MSINVVASSFVVGLASLHFPIGHELGQTLTLGHEETYHMTQGAVGELPDKKTAYNFCQAAFMQFRFGKLKRNFTVLSLCHLGQYENVGEVNFFESRMTLPASLFKKDEVKGILADTCWLARAAFVAGGYDHLRAVGWLLNDSPNFTAAQQLGLGKFVNDYFKGVMSAPLECTYEQDNVGVYKIRVRVPFNEGENKNFGIRRSLEWNMED